MKRILFLLLISVTLFSCKNFDIDHPDYKYTSGYFPYQFPVRTLVLGDYIYDNTNDNAHKFLISAAIGGVYNNDRNRVFDIEVDNTLCDNVIFGGGGDTIVALPNSYYNLSSNQIIIPKGKMNAGIEVQLTDAFFNDPLSIKMNYVVPIRLLGSNDVDTILVGKSSNPYADIRFASEWEVAPKNFTMFAVKYINEFHGTYFHYGSSKVIDGSNNEIENTVYSADFVEKNPILNLVTTGRNQVSVSTFFESEVMTGEIDLLLTFSGDNCTVTAGEDFPYTVNGSGQFKSKEYAWGNKDRDGIEITYSISNGTYTYQATDVLVIRDRSILMEIYNPALVI